MHKSIFESRKPENNWRVFDKVTNTSLVVFDLVLLFFFAGELLQPSFTSSFRPHKQAWLEERRSFRRGLSTTTPTKTGGDKITFHCGRWLICWCSERSSAIKEATNTICKSLLSMPRAVNKSFLLVFRTSQPIRQPKHARAFWETKLKLYPSATVWARLIDRHGGYCTSL